MLSSLLLAVITWLNALLHFLLLLGAPLGEYVLGGKYKIVPKNRRFLNLIFFLLFTFLGAVYFQYTKKIPLYLPETVSLGIIILFTLFYAYGIIGNLKFTSSKKERYVMTPVCIISFILNIILLVNIF